MRIAMLSDHEWYGGAAISAGRLAEGLVSRGHSVTRIVENSSLVSPRWELIHLTPAFGRSRSFRAVRGMLGEEAQRVWDAAFAQHWLNRVLQRLSPDVVNIHNMHGAGWSTNLVKVCMRHAPAVWTLHDMWSFTGRCGFSLDCRKFMSGCDSSCPTPSEYPALNPTQIAGEWRRKAALQSWSNGRLVGVSPSTWLAREARLGMWICRMETIPYGIDLAAYSPMDRSAAREALGIEKGDQPVLLAAAQYLNDRRKGFDLLTQALHQTGRATLLTFGAGKLEPPANVKLKAFGELSNDRTKAMVYSAADIYIHSAVADNLPNTVMEAIACGTPCLAFPAGGVVDLVRPGLTGWLTSEVSVPALVQGIRDAVAAARSQDLRENCRRVAEAEYNLELQAERYEHLFESMRTPSPQ